MLTDLSDGRGTEFNAVELRYALANYAADIMAYWTKQFSCSTSALLFMYFMEDQYRILLTTGEISTSINYTTRALEARSGIPKSTIQRKLKHLERLGVIKLDGSNILIPRDENGRVVLPRKLPLGRKITETAVNNIHSIFHAQ